MAPKIHRTFFLLATAWLGFFIEASTYCHGQDLHASDDQFADSLSLLLKQWHALPEASIEVVGLGAGARGLDEVPGSLHVIGAKGLERFSFSDPLRVLQSVSGVNIQEEDGYGLRPNIGLRGSGSERSARITLMEDGILIAPAPYTAPSAYYFPSIARMQSVEILKGSSQIAFGPQTAGGAINLISLGFENGSPRAMYRTEWSGNAGRLDHFFMRESWARPSGTWSMLAEGLGLSSDGFKDLPNAASTGFDKQDVLVKARWASPASQSRPQWIELKWGHVVEDSHETYAGLSESDFEANPFQRYAASAHDELLANQSQAVISHHIENSNWSFKTDLYRTHFHRNWYKLDRMVDSTGTKWSLLQIFETENTDWLKVNSPEGAAFHIKANNRDYLSQGIQHRGIRRWGTSDLGNQLVYGLRWHQDEVDRFEWRDAYQLVEGEMNLMQLGQPGTAGNRLDRASAFASYIRATIRMGSWTWTPGLRSERMQFERLDFELNESGERSNVAVQERSNAVAVWLPGIGLNRNFSDHFAAFMGLHRGFIPPGSAPETRPETSVNWEIGGRLQWPNFQGQVVGFSNAYKNLMGSDLTANGGMGSGDLFNGGSAETKGLEVECTWDAMFENPNWALPIRASYTWTSARFTSAFESDFEPWNVVESGDFLPYLAPHQGNLSATLAHASWSMETNMRYVDPMRTQAGQGALIASEITDPVLVFDAMLRVQFSPEANAYVGVNNLLDSHYVVARRPAGLRPGLPRLIRLGLQFKIG